MRSENLLQRRWRKWTENIVTPDWGDLITEIPSLGSLHHSDLLVYLELWMTLQSKGCNNIKLEQLERLRSEDTPRRPMITHTIDQFILNPKSILLTSSYQIPSQNKMKNLRKIEIL